MRLPQKRRLLPHFYHKREIRKTRKTRKRSSRHFGHDGHSASEPPFFYAKSVDFQGFFDILSEKTSGLSNAQAAAGMVEVTGFEPATFWSRTKRATKLRYTSNGANEGTRTLDLRFTKPLLYRLSHIGIAWKTHIHLTGKNYIRFIDPCQPFFYFLSD